MEQSVKLNKKYCEDLYSLRRLKTHEVNIGGLGMGAGNPIRIQSMTTTDTMDTDATVAQTLRMVESGCELVRITAPSINEAKNLEVIRKKLHEAGCRVPLVADIHFTPNAAEVAARIVEKVRVNPGNYADKKKFQEIEYTDDQYQAELDRIRERFSPLVKICKEYGTAMRIGTNHGSLSDRIMSRYGDTPLGMVESALEFLDICEDLGYHNIVLSMKASNPLVMVQAYRLLVNRMLQREFVYPLHLGVTEAGEGMDGRIKSAQGIGALLMDGIGDTVRVSLTEDPEFEAPVAKFLVDLFTQNHSVADPAAGFENIRSEISVTADPFEFNRRETVKVGNFGGGNVPRVIADASAENPGYEFLRATGFDYDEKADKYKVSEAAADYVFAQGIKENTEWPGSLPVILPEGNAKQFNGNSHRFSYWSSPDEFFKSNEKNSALNFVAVNEKNLTSLKGHGAHLQNVILVAESETGNNPGHFFRMAASWIASAGIHQPVVLKLKVPDAFSFYDDRAVPEKYRISPEAKAQLYIAAVTSIALIDGWADGVWITPGNENTVRTSFGILQACRQRITRTEYISCPSCGRTLFDLMETTAKIREKTSHLKGLKIGIMGCIVNGPGEMADADYGYVGVGVGKIALYRGKEVVEKGVPSLEAVEKLIDLIKSDGKWIDV